MPHRAHGNPRPVVHREFRHARGALLAGEGRYCEHQEDCTAEAFHAAFMARTMPGRCWPDLAAQRGELLPWRSSNNLSRQTGRLQQ